MARAWKWAIAIPCALVAAVAAGAGAAGVIGWGLALAVCACFAVFGDVAYRFHNAAAAREAELESEHAAIRALHAIRGASDDRSTHRAA